MAMTAGSVSIASDGTVTGTGFAKAFWDDYTPKLALPVNTPLASLHGIADLVNSIATVIGYVQANAQGKIASTDAGLQRTPSGGAGTPTDGPSTDKFIAIV